MAGWGLAIGGAVGACQGAPTFLCGGDGECTNGSGMSGTCEASGRCSFPDEGCDSGRRYGEFAGGLSGQCVDDDVDTGTGSDGATSSADTAGPEPDGTDTTPDDSTVGGSSIELSDDDEADFAAGTWEGVTWLEDGLGDGIGLDGVDEGTLRSRVFDAGQPVTWTTLRWSPRGPYGKPLPDGGLSERGYAEGGADMSDSVLLLHLDGRGTASPGTLLPDASGQDHDFLLESPTGLPWVPGIFGQALADDMDSYAHDGAWVDDFSFGEEGFTWSLWARSNAPCVGTDVGSNQVYLGIEGPGSPRSHLWLGCRYPTSGECPEAGGTAGRLGGTYDDPVTTGPRLCGSTELVDDRWHHLAVTKRGHEDAVVAIYLDGRVEDLQPHAYGASIEFPFGTELALGAFTNGTFPAAGTFDEVAIWRRGLMADEVTALYHRGVLRLTLEVRACADPECSDQPPFVGPDGIEGSVFVDPSQALAPGTELSLPAGLFGQYFQYRARLQGPGGASPVLQSVTLGAITD